MKIGFDASRAFTKNRTGTENYSFQILHNLSLIDHTNTYFVYCRPKTISNITLASQGSTLRGWPDNFKFIIIPYPRLWTQVGLARQTFFDKLDILFIPAHTLPLIKKPGLKTMVTVHDLGAEYLPQTHQLKQRLYLKLMTDFQLKSATHLIAVSQATKDDLIKKVGIPEKKISVVYEGYDQEKFKVQSSNPIKSGSKFKIDQTLKEYHLQPKSYFLFVGTIQPRKNLERLILAFSKYSSSKVSPKADGVEKLSNSNSSRFASAHSNNNIQLVLAGSKGWLSDEIYELPKKLGIENQVKFLGYVPDEKLPALYSGAKAFLFPSLFEGFGIPILEAFASGCPVLTSNISSMPEVAGNAAVLVDPYSVDDIAQGMEKITDKKLSYSFIKKGQSQVKKFSWEKAAKKTLQVLEKTVKH